MTYKSDLEDKIRELQDIINSNRITDQEEYDIAVDLIADSDAWGILKTPGVMDAIQEYYRETILEKWKVQREEELQELLDELKSEDD